MSDFIVRLTADELATAKTLIDLAKRFLPPHITEQEQARAYLKLAAAPTVEALVEDIVAFTNCDDRPAIHRALDSLKGKNDG